MKKITLLAGVLIASLLINGCTKGESEAAGSGAESKKDSLVVQLDDGSFDAAIAGGVVLVDFWAPWCPPCRQQLPLVDKAAELLKGVAKVAKLNVDEGQKTAAKFNVASIPTLIIFKEGKEFKKFVGVTQPEVLVEAVESALRN